MWVKLIWRRSVSATQQADGSYMCNEVVLFVSLKYIVSSKFCGDTRWTRNAAYSRYVHLFYSNDPRSQINNGRRNPLFGQSSVVRLPNGMVTMYFSTAGNQFNPDGIDQLFNLLLQGISRHVFPLSFWLRRTSLLTHHTGLFKVSCTVILQRRS